MKLEANVKIRKVMGRLAADILKSNPSLFSEEQLFMRDVIAGRKALSECSLGNEFLGRISAPMMWYLVLIALIEIKKQGRKIEESDEIWQIITSPYKYDRFSVLRSPRVLSEKEAKAVNQVIVEILNDDRVNEFEKYDLAVFGEELLKLQQHLDQLEIRA